MAGQRLREWIARRIRKIRIEVTAVWYAYRDPEIGILPKAVLFLTIAYAFSPIDLIPDFIPVLGLLDDLLILPLLIGLSVRLIPEEIYTAARQKAETASPIAGQRRWLFVPLIISLWILPVLMLLRIVLRQFDI